MRDQPWGPATVVTIAVMGIGAVLFLHTCAAMLPDPAEIPPRPRQTPGASLPVAWQTTGPLDEPVDGACAIAVGADGRLRVLGKDALVTLDEEGRCSGRERLAVAVDRLGPAPDGLLLAGGRDLYRQRNGVIEAWAELPEPAARITSLAGAPDGGAWVADAGSRSVWRLAVDGSVRLRLGSATASPPAFHVPSPFFDLVPTIDGGAWVANPGHHRVERWTAIGQRVAQWGRAGGAEGLFAGCCNPADLALLPDGRLVCGEKGAQRLIVFTPQGRAQAAVAEPQRFSTGSQGLDLAVDGRGRIWALDRSSRKLHRFTEIRP